MRDNLGNIDGLFRDNLHDYSAPPPADAWEKIANSLPMAKKNKASYAWIRIAASIVLLIGSGVLSWNYFSPDKLTPVEIVQEQVIDRKDLAEPSVSNTQISSIPENTDKNSSTAPIIHIPKKIQPASIQNQQTSIAVAAAGPSSATEEPIIIEENLIITKPSEEEINFADLRTIQLDYNKDPDVPQAYIKPRPIVTTDEIIIQNNLLALEVENKQKEKTNWSIAGQAGPQYSYRDVYNSSASYPVENYDDYESGVLAYAGGIHVEMARSSRFSIQSGVYYSKIGQTKSSLQINNQFSDIGDTYSYRETNSSRSSNAPTNIVNSTGAITFDDTNKDLSVAWIESNDIEWEQGIVSGEQYFEFVEIPFIVKYKFIDKKVDVNVSTGIWANIMVGNKAIVTDNKTFSTKGETNNINTLNYSGSLSLGVGYPISSKLSLSLEPFFKYYLTPINTNPETSVYPYSMGVLSGVQYTF